MARTCKSYRCNLYCNSLAVSCDSVKYRKSIVLRAEISLDVTFPSSPSPLMSHSLSIAWLDNYNGCLRVQRLEVLVLMMLMEWSTSHLGSVSLSVAICDLFASLMSFWSYQRGFHDIAVIWFDCFTNLTSVWTDHAA